MKQVTEQQAKVFSILVNLALKAMLVLAFLIAFFWILAVLLSQAGKWEWQKTTGFVCLESLLAGTLFVVVQHYFPSIKNASSE